MGEVRCPKCGSVMVLRRAKKGPNAGSLFYGCSRYPLCKATLPYESAEGEKPNDYENRPSTQLSFPHNLVAREKFKGYQSRFFESVAVPASLLEEITSEDLEDLDSELLMAFSQWRIDFPHKGD
ncbi:MAG: topoisomerase DNA-binding C4 zinc finger domain-containing protein, partial [Pseudothermotoga sp.]